LNLEIADGMTSFKIIEVITNNVCRQPALQGGIEAVWQRIWYISRWTSGA
jgi:hypothetical protein